MVVNKYLLFYPADGASCAIIKKLTHHELTDGSIRVERAHLKIVFNKLFILKFFFILALINKVINK